MYRALTLSTIHCQLSTDPMSTFRNPVTNFSFETVVSFIAALLIVPIVIKLLVSTVRGLLQLGVVRRLLVNSLAVGVTALFTREDFLNRVFGPRRKQLDKRG